MTVRYVMNTTVVYWSISIFTAVLGLVLIAAPDFWFGPTWHQFGPHSGFWLGFACLVMGYVQSMVIGMDAGPRIVSIVYLVSGCVFWLVGVTFVVVGVKYHSGVMEAPFICYVGAHCLAHSAALNALANQQKRDRVSVAAEAEAVA